MIAWWIGWAAAVCALVYLIGFCWRGPSISKSVVKTASVGLLAVHAALAGGPVTLVVALGLCALGDLLLSLDRERAFLAGVGAFAAAHLVFVAVILTLHDSNLGLLTAPWRLLVLGGLSALGVAMAVLLWRTAGALRGAVVCYIPIILAMGIAALTLPLGGFGVMVLFGAGMIGM